MLRGFLILGILFTGGCENLAGDPIRKLCTDTSAGGSLISLDLATGASIHGDVVSEAETCGSGCLLFPLMVSRPPRLPAKGEVVRWRKGPLALSIQRARNASSKYEMAVFRRRIQHSNGVIPQSSAVIETDGIAVLAYREMNDFRYKNCGKSLLFSDIDNFTN
jgi:hypothetical protein